MMKKNNYKHSATILLRLKKNEKEYLSSLAKAEGKTVQRYIKDVLSVALEKDYRKTEVFSIIKDCMAKISDEVGDDLNQGIVYGSYARGDFRDNSDIDLLILLNKDSKETRDNVTDIICDFNTVYNICISPIILEKDIYDSINHGVYRNIKNEGVVVYGS